MGRISHLAGSVQAATRSEQVEIDIFNPKEELKPGISASASLPVTRPQSSIFVLKSALVIPAERTYVVRVANGHASLIEKGNENYDQVQVFGKLKASDVVLRNGTEDIADQQAVQ